MPTSGLKSPAANTFDWQAYDRWQDEVSDLNDGLEARQEGGRIINLPVRYDREGDERRTSINTMAEESTPSEPD